MSPIGYRCRQSDTRRAKTVIHLFMRKCFMSASCEKRRACSRETAESRASWAAHLNTQGASIATMRIICERIHTDGLAIAQVHIVVCTARSKHQSISIVLWHNADAALVFSCCTGGSDTSGDDPAFDRHSVWGGAVTRRCAICNRSFARHFPVKRNIAEMASSSPSAAHRWRLRGRSFPRHRGPSVLGGLNFGTEGVVALVRLTAPMWVTPSALRHRFRSSR
jgi:hypothetical protein